MKTDDWSKAFNMRLLGLARLKFDAYCFDVWEQSGRSMKLSFQETFRLLILHPENFQAVEVRPHRCSKCNKLYGSPYCWIHGEQHTQPEPDASGSTILE